MSGLNIVTWFVGTHVDFLEFAWIFLCVKINQTTGKIYKTTNSLAVETIGVKTPSVFVYPQNELGFLNTSELCIRLLE